MVLNVETLKTFAGRDAVRFYIAEFCELLKCSHSRTSVFR